MLRVVESSALEFLGTALARDLALHDAGLDSLSGSQFVQTLSE